MRLVTRFVRRSIIALGLVALTVVLFPNHMQPLWDWGKTISAAFGHDLLPSFGMVHQYAGYSLLALVIGGMVYNVWRDRRYEVLQAEYAHQTGAKHLKQRVRELESQLEKTTFAYEALQRNMEALKKEHTAALVASKEHEVRSQYGQEDREALREVRRQFERLLTEKGHLEGFREAMEMMMTNISQSTELGEVSAERSASNGKANPRDLRDQRNRAALPFGMK